MTYDAEAKQWLQGNPHPAGLASNRFATTRDAMDFVNEIYQAGAIKVLVKDVRQEPEGGYSDTLIVELPIDPVKRKNLFAIAKREANREGYAQEPDIGQAELLLWWD